MSDSPDQIKKPLTDEVYCLMVRSGVLYHTIAITPLWKEYVAQTPYTIKCSIGQHTFISTTDQVTYLLPYDHPMCRKYVVKMETLKLYPEGQTPVGLKSEISFPMVLASGIMPYCSFKISKEGNLYKRKGTDEWLLCKV